jgi:hypothetical protein
MSGPVSEPHPAGKIAIVTAVDRLREIRSVILRG